MKIFICSLGHPSRQIVRSKKYMTTSSSDKDQVKTSRTDQCDRSDQTINIEKDISEIRDALNINKENEVANILTEHASPLMINNPSFQLMNPVAQLYNPPNIITEACEQYSVPQKTYTELLPSSSTSGFNVYTSESTSFPHSTSSPHMYESRNGRISYEKSFGTASFCESVAPRNVAHQNQVTCRIISL